MTIVEMANYVTDVFPENKPYYKEHDDSLCFVDFMYFDAL